MKQPVRRIVRIIGIGVNCQLDHGFQSLAQSFRFRVAQCIRATLWRDTRLVQNLIGDPIAHAGRKVLIQ